MDKQHDSAGCRLCHLMTELTELLHDVTASIAILSDIVGGEFVREQENRDGESVLVKVFPVEYPESGE